MRLKFFCIFCLAFISACSSLPQKEGQWPESNLKPLQESVSAADYHDFGEKYYYTYKVAGRLIADHKQHVDTLVEKKLGFEGFKDNQLAKQATIAYFLEMMQQLISASIAKEFTIEELTVIGEALQTPELNAFIACKLVDLEDDCNEEIVKQKIEAQFSSEIEVFNKKFKGTRSKNKFQFTKTGDRFIVRDFTKHLTKLQARHFNAPDGELVQKSRKLAVNLLSGMNIQNSDQVFALVSEGKTITGSTDISDAGYEAALFELKVNGLTNHFVRYMDLQELSLLQDMLEQPQSQAIIQEKFLQALHGEIIFLELDQADYQVKQSKVADYKIHSAVTALSEAAYNYSLRECLIMGDLCQQ